MDDPAWLDALRWKLRQVEPKRWMAAACALCAVALVSVAVWWFVALRVRKPPSIFDAPVDDTLGYLALKDFSKLPVDERVRFMLDFAQRFRGMQPGESAAAAAFLCSNAAAYITGAVLNINGGVYT